MNSDLAEVGAILHSVREEVRRLSRLVHEGNGKEPLISRVALLEMQIDKAEQRLEEWAIHRWQVTLALVSGIISLMVSGLVYFLSKA